MKRPLCWISLGCFAAAAAFCSFYPAKEWVFPAIALFGLSGLFCLLSTRTRPAAIFSFSAAFMLLFCLLYGRLFAKPALDLSGRTLSLSGTVLETGHTSFLLDGETESGQALLCGGQLLLERILACVGGGAVTACQGHDGVHLGVGQTFDCSQILALHSSSLWATALLRPAGDLPNPPDSARRQRSCLYRSMDSE